LFLLDRLKCQCVDFQAIFFFRTPLKHAYV
jgi:hypothetical protein